MNARAADSGPQAVIMAGGEGRRMGSLTAQVPKPMLHVGGRPLLQQQIERLRDQEITRIALAVRYRANVIVDHFGDGSSLGVSLRYVQEREPLGTAGALGLLEPWASPLLVLNGDIATDIPVGELLRHHDSCRADLTVCCVSHALPVPYGVVHGSYPAVSALREKPSVSMMVNAGVYVLNPAVQAFLRPARPVQMPELVDRTLAAGRVASFRLSGPWIDIGTPEQYALACDRALQPVGS
jgi:NDP-sugar pyrophosphorylase family protein